MSVETRLARLFVQAHPLEAARSLERLPETERNHSLDRLPLDGTAAVLGQMEASLAAAALARRSEGEVTTVLAAMPARNAALLLERFDAVRRQEIFACLPKKMADALRRLMHHAEDTAGALMDPRVAAFPEDISVREARKRVQRQPRKLQYYLYVVDRADRLVGVVTLRELLLASSAATLASVMHTQVARLSVRASREAIVAHPAWRDVHALPVVGKDGTLAGVLRYDTLRQLEAASATDRPPALLPAGLALAELYWSAATALLLGLFDTVRPAGEPDATGEST